MKLALTEAIRAAGGVAAAGRACGVSRQAVAQWDACPPEHVIALCAAGSYVVTPHRLRQDLYPHPADGLPAALRILADLGPLADVLRADEHAQLTAALLGGNPADAVRAIEGFEVDVAIRAQLLEAARQSCTSKAA